MIYDYIIIGSGFGGSVAALRLAEKGYKVLILEQGKRFNPEDFDEFFTNTSWQRFGDWKQILEPYYDKASFMLGRKKYSRLNVEDKLLEEVSKDMNAHDTFETVHVGVNLDKPELESDPYFNGMGPLRKGCIECGGCMVGCRENAKNTLDRNYLWFAEKMGAEIIPETKAEKISYFDSLYHVETKNLTSFIRKRKDVFTSKGIIIASGALGTLELLLKQKYKYNTLPFLSETLGHELRTNAETLCAVSGGKEKLNNGLAITSVFSPDPLTHVEIVKYPDNSNIMKWFFGLSVGGAKTSRGRSWKHWSKSKSDNYSCFGILYEQNSA